MGEELTYIHGLHNHAESESLPNALTKGQNSPQKAPYGLYAEQLNCTAFTVPRLQNHYSWLYRIRPSVKQSEFTLVEHTSLCGTPFDAQHTPPTQMRWDPLPYPTHRHHFIEGLYTFAGNGSIESQTGAAIHYYTCNRSMENCFFYNADGEFLIVPQEGELRFKTEFGWLDASPGEILLIPRGVKFQVDLLSDHARGYICENFGEAFKLPDLGVIGANGLANPRDFQKPTARFEDAEGEFILYAKFQGNLWQSSLTHHPLDVVAWHGTIAPYKYDLSLFNVINTVSFDHPDPSIFTVLTAPSGVPGTANIDFVIFPPRWMVASNTFRPPYYHRNIMSEFMGLIHGQYDAKEKGFLPGGATLHNCMTAHGPDTDAFDKASNQSLKPEYYSDTLAFMFESRQVWRLTAKAYNATFRQKDYLSCWEGLQSHFSAKEATI